MIKPTNKTCNKEVQKFTNTSYDILLDLYNNTAFFKDLWDYLNPGYYLDFSGGLGGWQATEGTGSLTETGTSVISIGGDFFNDSLDIDADTNKFLSVIFDGVVSGFIGDVEITYNNTDVVLYSGVITHLGETSASVINLEQFEEHTGKITGIRFILNNDNISQYTLYKIVVGKPLLTFKSLIKLESEILSLDGRVSLLEQQSSNQDSRLNSLEEKPVILLNPDSLDEDVLRYELVGLRKEDITKKVIFKNDVIELINSAGNSYFKYNITEGFYEYKGILVLNDGTVITGVEDIRAFDGEDGSDGDYQEFRFARSTATPTIDNTEPNPSNFFVNPPTGELPLWFVISKKRSDGTLISNWSNPVRISGESGVSGDSVIAYLTSENYIAVSNADGTNPNLSAAGGEFVLTKNGTKVTSGVTYSGGVSKNGLNLIINPNNGLFNLTSNNWSTDVEFFDLTASFEGKTYTKRYSVIKQKNTGGGGGSNTITLLLYKSTVRAATSLSGPSGPVTFNTATLSLTENSADALNGWSLLMPENTLPKRWVVQAIISTTSSTVQIQPSQWSTARVFSIDGVDGEDGGGGSGGTGLDGFSRATVYAYKAGQTVGVNDTPGDTLYTFSTGVAALSNGWSSSIPTTDLPVWVRTGLAISRTATDTINTNEWSEAVKITGSSLNSAQLFIYKRTASSTPPVTNDRPTVSAAYNFETGLLTGLDNGWTNVPPLSSGRYLWIRAAMAASSTLTDNIPPSEWSEPRLLASDGSDGSSSAGEAYPGAERKGATYPSFNWNSTGVDSATARWGTLAGRSPVAGDVFIQVSSATGATEVRAYNGTAWVQPAAVYESLVTFGVLSGEQILAGSVINAPVIRGGSLELTGNSASAFITIIRNDPFGPNNLVEWFGPKINGVTWNTATNAPIYGGMRMSNAKTYKTVNGDVYFGGVFRAGTLSSAQTSTVLTHTPSSEMTFGSNGGDISITGSVTYGYDDTSYSEGTCPPAGADPILTVFVEQLVGSTWQIRSQQNFTGFYFCEPSPGPGEPRIISKGVGGSVTYLDSSRTTSNKTYRVRGLISGNYSTNAYTYVAASIASSE